MTFDPTTSTDETVVTPPATDDVATAPVEAPADDAAVTEEAAPEAEQAAE